MDDQIQRAIDAYRAARRREREAKSAEEALRAALQAACDERDKAEHAAREAGCRLMQLLAAD